MQLIRCSVFFLTSWISSPLFRNQCPFSLPPSKRRTFRKLFTSTVTTCRRWMCIVWPSFSPSSLPPRLLLSPFPLQARHPSRRQSLMPSRWQWSWRPGQGLMTAGTRESDRKVSAGGSGLSRLWCQEGIPSSQMRIRSMSSWRNSEPPCALLLYSETWGDAVSATSLETETLMALLGFLI